MKIINKILMQQTSEANNTIARVIHFYTILAELVETCMLIVFFFGK